MSKVFVKSPMLSDWAIPVSESMLHASPGRWQSSSGRRKITRKEPRKESPSLLWPLQEKHRNIITIKSRLGNIVMPESPSLSWPLEKKHWNIITINVLYMFCFTHEKSKSVYCSFKGRFMSSLHTYVKYVIQVKGCQNGSCAFISFSFSFVHLCHNEFKGLSKSKFVFYESSYFSFWKCIHS